MFLLLELVLCSQYCLIILLMSAGFVLIPTVLSMILIICVFCLYSLSVLYLSVSKSF